MTYIWHKTIANKLLGNKAFNIAKNPKYDGYQSRLASVIYNFFERNALCGTFKNGIISNKELPEELRKTIIKHFEKRKVHLLFMDNIWGIHPADMKLLSKFNEGFRLLCVIDIYSKYPWVIPLKDSKVITIVNVFQKLLHDSKLKPNKQRQ